LTEKVVEVIHNYEKDFHVTVSPDKYIIVVGEDTFYRIVEETKSHDPFFSEFTRFPVDAWYNTPYKSKIMGWYVYVAPAVDGFLVLPKAIIEEKIKHI
jgi:hypothetical protein